MEIKKRIEEFDKRWGIVDKDYTNELCKFKNRVLNIFETIDTDIEHAGIEQFCQIMGIITKWDSEYSGGQRWTVSKNIIRELKQAVEEVKLYRILEVIFLLPFYNRTEDYKGKRINTRNAYYLKLEEAINLSAINLSINIKNDEIILYPRGEKVLDNLLVNESLSFLNPESENHFIDSLKFYQKRSTKDSIKSAESVRRAIEEFLRFKMANKKGLKENINELLKKLKEDKRDAFIRNVIFSTFSSLDSYFNDNSKHEDGDINEQENEYLIYQAGLLMRYINQTIG